MNQAGGDLAVKQETKSILWQGEFLTHKFRLVLTAPAEPQPGEPPALYIVEQITQCGAAEAGMAMGQMPLIEGVPDSEILGWLAAQIYQAALVRGRRVPLDAVTQLADQIPGAVSEAVRNVLGLNGTPIIPAIRYIESKIDPRYRNVVKISEVDGKFHVSLAIPEVQAIPISGDGVDTEARAEAIATQLVQALDAIARVGTVVTSPPSS